MDPIKRDISPSQIKLYRQCPRSFAFRYVEGFKTEQSDAMKHGSLMHKHLELYLLRGKRPPHAHAMAVLREAPKPLTALAEAKIIWSMGQPWTYQGIMDFSGALISRANFTTSAFMNELAHPIVIGDFKFTSQLKYALLEKDGVLIDRESGEVDPQSTMYAARYFSKGYEKVHGKWIYSRTTGKSKVHPVWVDFSRERVLGEMAGSIAKDAAEIHQLYQIRPKGNEVRYDKSGCFAFNKVCDHIAYCNRPTRMFDCAETDAEPAGAEDMGFADDFMKNFPGTEDPPSLDEEIPDLDGEEIPELEGERDALTEEEQTEIVEQEIAKQRREAGRVEKGFVNPEEAPDLAASTPEEAFERFGDAVAEKVKKPKAAKEPAMKFGTKQRGKLFAKALELGLVQADNDDRAPVLAKTLAKAGVDLAALFPELVPTVILTQTDVVEEEIPLLEEEVPEVLDVDGLPVTCLASQANADQAAAHREQLELDLNAAIIAEAAGADGAAEAMLELEDRLADLDESIPDVGELEDVVTHDLTGDELAEKMTQAIAEAQAQGRDTSGVEQQLVDAPTVHEWEAEKREAQAFTDGQVDAARQVNARTEAFTVPVLDHQSDNEVDLIVRRIAGLPIGALKELKDAIFVDLGLTLL